MPVSVNGFYFHFCLPRDLCPSVSHCSSSSYSPSYVVVVVEPFKMSQSQIRKTFIHRLRWREIERSTKSDDKDMELLSRRRWTSRLAQKKCDQNGRFITLWVTFQSLWQQLFCPKCKHILGNFCKSFLGNF